jgi:hypothetical protein
LWNYELGRTWREAILASLGSFSHGATTAAAPQLYELSQYVVAEILAVQRVLLAANYMILSHGG